MALNRREPESYNRKRERERDSHRRREIGERKGEREREREERRNERKLQHSTATPKGGVAWAPRPKELPSLNRRDAASHAKLQAS